MNTQLNTEGNCHVYIMERHFLLKSSFCLREFSGDLEVQLQGTDCISGSLEMISLGQIQRTVHSLSSNENEKRDVLRYSLPTKGGFTFSLNSNLTELIFIHLIKFSTFQLKCYFYVVLQSGRFKFYSLVISCSVAEAITLERAQLMGRNIFA